MTMATHSPLSPSVFSRFKQAVRKAIDHCGGSLGAGATSERAEQTAREWNNRNGQAFPPVDCAFAMDEASLIKGQRPEILLRYAAELGFAAVQLPEVAGTQDAEAMALIEAVEEVGQAAGAIRDMVADGVREPHERDRCAREIDDVINRFVRLRAIVAGPVGSVRQSGEAIA